MKKVLLLLAILMSSNSFAADFLSNQECIDVYRTGYLNLSEAVRKFNDGSNNRYEFSTEVSANSTVIGVVRGACLAVESTSIEDCVGAYRDLYKDLRKQIKLGAILMGNQTAVAYSKKMQQVIEEDTRVAKKDTLWGKIKKSLKIGAGVVTETFQRTKDITMLEFIDAKCGN